MSARFDSRLVVSKETSVRIRSKPTSCGATTVAAAGAFMARYRSGAWTKDRNRPAGCQSFVRQSEAASTMALRPPRRSCREPQCPLSAHPCSSAGLLAGSPSAAAADLPLDSIKLPPGFAIELVARVPNAREMALGTNGTLFVGSMEAGKVYAVTLRPGARRLCYDRRDRAAAAGGRRVSRQGALCLRGQSHPSLRRHRKPTGQSAAAGAGQRPVSERRAAWLEVHCLRPRRQALRAGRCAVQHLRARP